MITTLMPNGFTARQPGDGGRQIYVDPDAGDDKNSGAEATLAVRTIKRAQAIATAGKPDLVMLKAGATFTEQLDWRKPGPTDGPPMMICAWGNSGRARFDAANVRGVDGNLATPINIENTAGIALLDMHVDGTGLTIAHQHKSGIRALGIAGFLAENNLVVAMGQNFNLGGEEKRRSRDFTVRRNVSVDSWDPVGVSVGLYCNWTDGLTIESNVFDHNGWKAGQPWKVPDQVIKNHDVYLAETNSRVLGFNNFLGRACSHGFQNRCNGQLFNNVFWLNAIHAFGQGDFSEFHNNLLFGSAALAGGEATGTHRLRAWGYALESVSGTAEDNLFVDVGQPPALNPYALQIGVPTRWKGYDAKPVPVPMPTNGRLKIRGNRAYKCVGPNGLAYWKYNTAGRELIEDAGNDWAADEGVVFNAMRVELAHVLKLRGMSRDDYSYNPDAYYSLLAQAWTPRPRASEALVVAMDRFGTAIGDAQRAHDQAVGAATRDLNDVVARLKAQGL